MDEFWAVTLWGLRIWLYLILALIMVPAMFGFSLGISETYMTFLVKTLEVPRPPSPPPPPPLDTCPVWFQYNIQHIQQCVLTDF